MYCEHIDENTKQIFGLTSKKYEGYIEVNDIEQAYNGQWYIKGYAPAEPEKSYIEKRLAEYPSVGDQMDMIYWDKVNGTNLWQQKIAEIKAKYPKN